MDGTPALTATGMPTQQPDAAQLTGPYRPGYELVAEQILQLIAESQLQPGDRMPTENELAAQLGTSRTVVREAIKILSATRAGRAQKGRGLYVADDEGMLGSSRWEGFFLPTDLDHVYMLFEFRRVQESEASRLAATRATPAELRAIEAAAQHVPGRTRDGAARAVRQRRRRLPPQHRGRLAQPVPGRGCTRGTPPARASPARSDCTARSAATPRKRSRNMRPSTRPSGTATGGRSARRRRAPGQHARGLPPRDQAPRVRLTSGD